MQGFGLAQLKVEGESVDYDATYRESIQTLDEAVDFFQRKFRRVVLGRASNRPFIRRGTLPYVTLCIGGVKAEGQPYPVSAATIEAEAAGYWLDEAEAFAKNNRWPSVLIWRQRPEIHRYGLRLQVHCRLALADRAPPGAPDVA